MNSATEISFVRHAEVENPTNVFYGRLDGFPLSATGMRQAQLLANRLKDLELTAIYSSPLLRAKQTAEAISAYHSNIPTIISELINEIKTPYDGYPIKEIEDKKWDVFSGTSSEYEKPIDVLNRLKEFVARVCQVHPGGHIVAVTHGHMIMLLTKWVNNESTDIEAMEDVSVPFVSVSTFSYITLKPDTRPDYRYFEPLANKSVKPL